MRENYWVNSLTNTELSVHSPAGSPRAWLLKAVGSPNGELYVMPGSLHPKTIAVAGLWKRDNAQLPDTGNNKTLYRFFDIPEKLTSKTHPKYNKKVPYIGMCVAVPAHEILTWIRAFKASGCVWLWWATPTAEEQLNHEEAVRLDRYRRLDHAEIFQLFDQGRTYQQLAKELNIQLPTIRYIHKKWEANQKPGKSFAPLSSEQVDNIHADLLEGILTQQQIADRYNTTRATVNKWAQRFNITSKGPNAKTKAASSSKSY
jgi:DNA-binding CsgD family transcriptional regulator